MKGIFLGLIILSTTFLIGHAQPSNPAPIVLPVKLTNFQGKAANGSSLLTWQTTMESNSHIFEVQHSVDGAQWTKAGTVQAAGNSTVTRNYSYTHVQPIDGLNYYRLRSVDLDGSSELSTTIHVTINSYSGAHIRLYPVPVSDHLIVETTGFRESFTYAIIDVNGKEVKRGIITRDKQRIPVQELKAGLYFLKTAMFEPIKFVK